MSGLAEAIRQWFGKVINYSLTYPLACFVDYYVSLKMNRNKIRRKSIRQWFGKIINYSLHIHLLALSIIMYQQNLIVIRYAENIGLPGLFSQPCIYWYTHTYRYTQQTRSHCTFTN